MSSPGIELGTSRTEGRALTETNCATLAPNLFRDDFFPVSCTTLHIYLQAFKCRYPVGYSFPHSVGEIIVVNFKV